jgi:hypothetical protein
MWLENSNCFSPRNQRELRAREVKTAEKKFRVFWDYPEQTQLLKPGGPKLVFYKDCLLKSIEKWLPHPETPGPELN